MEINPHFSDNAKNDIQLVEQAKTGSQKAFADLMQRYKDSIYFMALKMVNNKDDAMDLTVETFGKAFVNIDKYKPDFAFSTWLFKIATNNCIDFIRRKRVKMVSIHDTGDEDDSEPLQISSEDLNPEETSIKKQKTERLKLIVDKLPQRYRNLVILRYYDELSYEEIAERLDLPVGTVKAALFRARDLLSYIIARTKTKSSSDF